MSRASVRVRRERDKRKKTSGVWALSLSCSLLFTLYDARRPSAGRRVRGPAAAWTVRDDTSTKKNPSVARVNSNGLFTKKKEVERLAGAVSE